MQQPANTQHSPHQDHAFSVDQAPHDSGDDPSDDGDGDGDGDGASDVGDYDPEAVTSGLAPSPQLVQPKANLKLSPQPTSKKAKTAGGFLVGDSDSEDDAPTPASNGLAVPGSIPQPRSPLQHSIGTQQVAQHAPNTGTPPQPSMATAAPNNGSGVAAPTASSKSNPAHDKITILEDRVREDPRGAMDAWMSLIADHRMRNKIDEARNVYERFLAVFPQAVSHNHAPTPSNVPCSTTNTRTG